MLEYLGNLVEAITDMLFSLTHAYLIFKKCMELLRNLKL